MALLTEILHYLSYLDANTANTVLADYDKNKETYIHTVMDKVVKYLGKTVGGMHH